MALTRTDRLGELSNATGDFSGGTGAYTTSAFTPSNNSLLAVSAFAHGSSGGSTNNFATEGFTISDSAGLTWTERAVAYGDAADTPFDIVAKLWTAPVATGASMTLTFDAGGKDVALYAVSAVDYTGYNTSSPVGATGANNQDTGFSGDDPASLTLSAGPASSSEVFATVGISKSAAGTTPGTGWTEIHDITNTSWGGLQSQIRNGSTSTSVDWANLRPGGGALFTYAAVAVEIKDASSGPTPVDLDLTFVNASAWVAPASSAAVAPTYPSGLQAGDIIYALLAIKPDTATVATPGGWALVTSQAVGGGTQGAGAGAIKFHLYRKISTGSESGTESFAITGGSSPVAYMEAWRPQSGATSVTFETETTTFYSRTTGSTTFGGTGAANLNLTAKDILRYVSGSADDQSSTHTISGLAATGATLGTLVANSPSGTIVNAQGNDISAAAAYAPVNSGTSSAAPSATVTGSTSETGGGFFWRISATGVLAIDLAVQDAGQAQAADEPSLTQVHNLTVQDSAQAQAADSPTLTQVHNLAVDDAAQAHSADNVTVSVTHVLVVADAAQAQTVDNVTLTQVHVLTVDDASQAQAAESPSLTQVHVLAVDDAAQAHTADNVTLGAATTLTVQDASQAQAVDSPSLTQVHVITVDDAGQAQTVDELTLTQVHNLTVQDAAQAQTADNATLTVGGIDLTVADATQAQTVDSAYEDAYSDSYELNLTQVHVLVVADASQAQSVDSPSLTQVHVITVDDAGQAQTVDELTLTQVHNLTVQDAAQAQTADNATLTVGGITLTVQDAAQAQSVDNVTLTQVHVLTVDDASQAQAAESPSLTQVHVLAVDDAGQAQSADSPTLAVGATNLTVQDASQAQAVDSVALTQVHVITVQDALHAHSADNVTLGGFVSVDLEARLGRRRLVGAFGTNRLQGRFRP